MDKTDFPEIFEDMPGDCDLDDVDDRLWRAHLRGGVITAACLALIMYFNDSRSTRLAGLAVLLVGGYENEFFRFVRTGIDVDSFWVVKDCTLPLKEVVVIKLNQLLHINRGGEQRD